MILVYAKWTAKQMFTVNEEPIVVFLAFYLFF